MDTLLPYGSHHICSFGKVLFSSPVNIQTPLKTDLLHLAFLICVWISQLVFFNKGPLRGALSLPFKKSLLDPKATGRDLFHVLIPAPSRGLWVSKPQEKPNEGSHLCHPFHPAERGRSVPAADPAPSAPRSSAPVPISRRCLALPGAGSPPKTPAPQRGPWAAARQKHPSRVSRHSPSSPAVCGGDSGGADPAQVPPGAAVSARCSGSPALPDGLRLPSRAINTKARREQQQKALQLSLSCPGMSSPGCGCQNLRETGAGQE